MITEILLAAGVGGTIFTVADHENLFGNNPLKLFWWERIFPAPAPAQLSPAQISLIQAQSRARIQAEEQHRRQALPVGKYQISTQQGQTFGPKGQSW